MAELPNVVPALPELFLALVIMALLMFGVFQKGGAADRDQGHGGGIDLHPVCALFQHRTDMVERAGEQAPVDAVGQSRLAQIADAGGNRKFGCGQGLAAEDQGFPADPEADALRPHSKGRRFHPGAAAEPQRQEIRHPEKRPDTADFNDVVGLARKAPAEAARSGPGVTSHS